MKRVTIVSMQAPKFKDGQIVTNGGRVAGNHSKGKRFKRGKSERLCSNRVDHFCKQIYAS